MQTSPTRLARLALLTSICTVAALSAVWVLAVRAAHGPIAPLEPRAAVERDLAAVAADRLRIAAPLDEVALEYRRGRIAGLAVGLGADLAAELDVEFEFVPLAHPGTGFSRLLDGTVDLVAFAHTPYEAGPLDVRWSLPFDQAPPVVLGRHAGAIGSVDDLRGRTLVVPRHTALEKFADRVARDLDGEVRIRRVSQRVGPRQLARAAARGKYTLVLMDERRALLEAAAFGPLEISAALDEPQPVRWAMRANAPELAEKVDAWLDRARREGQLAEAKRQYLENPLRLKYRRRPTFRAGGRTLSPWDDLFQQAADANNLDWRLLAAISFAESGYDPWEVSPVGAMGLLQLMPGTAREFGAVDPFDPVQNVDAGARHLRWLFNRYPSVENPAERLAFAVSAYNMGLGHVADARTLAAQRGLNPNRWTGHVETMIPLLEDPAVADDLPSGRAQGTVNLRYVQRVVSLYDTFGGGVDTHTLTAQASPTPTS